MICLASYLIISGISVLLYHQKQLINDQRHYAKLRGERIAHIVSTPVGDLDKPYLDELLLQNMNDDDVNAIVIKGADGRIVAGKRKLNGTGKMADVLDATDIPVSESKRFDSHPVLSRGRLIGHVEMFLNDEEINNKLKLLLLEEFAQAVIPLFIVCLVLYVGISKLLLTPLAAVFNMARVFGAGDLSARVQTASENEIGTLAITFNRMADRIEEKIGQLADAEKQYRSLFESIQDVFYREDKDGIVRLVSPSIEKMLGYCQSEVIGRDLGDFCALSGSRALLFAEASRDGLVEDYDLLLKHRDGRIITVSANSHLYYDEQGAVAGIEGTFRDVTDRTRAFEEISQLKSSFAEIVETLPSAIIVVNGDLRIELMNRLAEEFCGFLLSQAKGVSVLRVLPAFENELLLIPQVISSKESYAREKLAVAGGFENRFYNFQIYPMKSKESSRAVIRFEDVTDKVRIQEALLQSEKMLMVGGLAAGTAHEINNPLAAILQNAQNIERRISPEIPANLEAAREIGIDLLSVRDYLERRGIIGFVTSIREGGARASKIITNMLQFSRKSGSRKELSDLNTLLDQSLELAASDYDLRKRYDFRQIRIEKDFASDLPMVSITVPEIEQVVLNIVKNAAQALSEANSADPCITLRTSRKDDFAVIEIEDNGPGMTELVRRRVFEPFFTTREVGSGTGLGMSVSYTIITTNHGGFIDVWSEPGEGARFTISLPIDRGGT
ncbi:PAS domain S-box protein [Geobacter sp. OR-1]|uniref:PAS domain S-box protein n=1 Tax=Geobacter sp. OR-1 TaxID=1266765 RepID=UPI001269F592|nr:PAS domain S-box protein [Geobacter sp. OR-1]